MLQKIFTLFGIDYDQCRALLKIYIKIDFRSTKQRLSGRHSSKRLTFIFTLFFYLFPSLMMAMFSLKFADFFGYCFLTLSLGFIFILLSVIIDFNEVLINPNDAEILACRPIHSRTYFGAKMANLLFYVTTFGLALNIPPAILGLFLPETNGYFVLVYLVTAWMGQIVVVSFVIILYTLLIRIIHYERLKDILAYIQIIFAFIVFLGYQFIIRLTEQINILDLSGFWNMFFPSAWFAGFISIMLKPVTNHFLFLTGTAFLFSIIVLYYAFRNVSLEYSQMIYKLSLSARIEEKSHKSWLSSAVSIFSYSGFIDDNVERVGYELVSKYIRRNRQIRMRLFPTFGLPLVIMVIFFIDGNFKDPLTPNAGFSTFIPLLFLSYSAFFFYQIIPTTDDWKASWIYYISPVANYAKIQWGSMKAVMIKYVTPFFIFIFAVFCLFMPIWHAFWVIIYSYLIFINFYLFLVFFAKDLPLSKVYERGQSNLRFMFYLVFFPFFAFCGLLEYYVFQHPGWLPAGLLFLLLLSWFFVKFAGKVFHNRIKKEECFF